MPANSTRPTPPATITDIPQSENVDGYDFPFAAAPDIIRSNQKDAYFQGVILDQLSNILRNLYGARILHRFSTEAKVLADLLYLGITTLVGSRTLGEEYCDIIHVDTDTRRLPNVIQRAGYILSVVVLPYITSKFAPKLRARIRTNLDRRAARRALTKASADDSNTLKERMIKFIHQNLDTIAGLESLVAVHLAFFYFSGAYYHVSKRIWGMRYIFTKRLQPHEQRVGYEVLGVLLLLQIGVQTYSKMSEFLADGSGEAAVEKAAAKGNNLVAPGGDDAQVDLENPETMAFVQGDMARKCTLCLESMRDPTLTPCGHMFCWACITEWCRNKPECPLCRSSSLPQHLLVLRV